MDSNPQSLGFEATEHLRNGMRKENFRKRLLEKNTVSTHTRAYLVVMNRTITLAKTCENSHSFQVIKMKLTNEPYVG